MEQAADVTKLCSNSYRGLPHWEKAAELGLWAAQTVFRLQLQWKSLADSRLRVRDSRQLSPAGQLDRSGEFWVGVRATARPECGHV